MVTAIVLIRAERGAINTVAQQLSDLAGVSEVYSISGRFDLAAIIRVKSNEELAELATNQMVKVKGIISTETMLAFQCFSKHDLESMFSVGD
jgi:transcriptional regulator, AsnC family